MNTTNTPPTHPDAATDTNVGTDEALSESVAYSPISVKSKVLAALLSFYGGWFGAHWYYLGRPRPWLLTVLAVVMFAIAFQSEVWWDSPAIFVVFIPAVAGFIEAMVLCLRSDEKFDARYNPGYKRVGHTGWGPILVAISGLLLGTIMTLFAIAHVVLHIWTRMGLLDGLNF
jgi:hypothetical protein